MYAQWVHPKKRSQGDLGGERHTDPWVEKYQVASSTSRLKCVIDNFGRRGSAYFLQFLCRKTPTHIFRDSLDPPGGCLCCCVACIVHPTKRIQHNGIYFFNGTVLLPRLNACASLTHTIVVEHHFTRPYGLLVPMHIPTDTQLPMLWSSSDYATLPMNQHIVHSIIPGPRGTSKQDENPLDQPGGRLRCRRIRHNEYKTKTHTSQLCGIPHTIPMDSRRRSR